MSYNGQKIIEQKQKQETAAREMRGVPSPED